MLVKNVWIPFGFQRICWLPEHIFLLTAQTVIQHIKIYCMPVNEVLWLLVLVYLIWNNKLVATHLSQRADSPQRGFVTIVPQVSRRLPESRIKHAVSYWHQGSRKRNNITNVLLFKSALKVSVNLGQGSFIFIYFDGETDCFLLGNITIMAGRVFPSSVLQCLKNKSWLEILNSISMNPT